MRVILLLLDKPEAEQDDAERDNNDSSSVHEKLKGMFRRDSRFCLLPSAFCLGCRVVSATPLRASGVTPRMTTANPLHRQPPARHRAPRADRVHRILRAGRRETAAAGRSE